MSPQVIVIAHTETNLAGNGVFRADNYEAAPQTQRKIFQGLSLLKGFLVSDKSGTLDIYQCFNKTDADAITNAPAPAAGTGNGKTLLNTFAYVSAGAADKGIPIAVPLVAPFVVVRYVNGAAAQGTFSLHIEAAE